MRLRRAVLALWIVAVLLLNAVATVVGMKQRWPAAFGVTPDPDHITVLSGSAIAAPLAPLLVLGACAVLVLVRSRWLNLAGAAGSVLLGILFIVATLAEPTTLHPEAALEEVFHVLALLSAAGLLGLGIWTLTAVLPERGAD
jgi:hypothetical protein